MTSDEDAIQRYRERAQRIRRRVLLAMLPLSVVAATAGVLLARHNDHRHRHVPVIVVVAIVAVTVLIAGTEIGILVWINRRRHGTWLPELSGLGGAPRAVRKRVIKSVRQGRLPDDPTERALAVDWADKIERARWVRWLFGVAVLASLPAVFLQHETLPRVLELTELVLVVALSVIFWWAFRRARAIHHLAERNQTHGA